MKSSTMTWILIIIFIQILCFATLGNAAMTVSAMSSGNGGIVVQVDGLAGFEGVEVDIKYDKSSLNNPRVTQGSLISGMPMVTHNEPGLLVYTGVDPFPKTRPGSGTIAEISFDLVGNSSSNVTGTATFKDPNGTVLLSQPFVVAVTGSNTTVTTVTSTPSPGNTGSGTDGSGTTGTGTTGTGTTGTGTTGTGTTGTGTTGTGTTGTGTTGTGSINSTVLGSVTMPGSGTPVEAKSSNETSPPVNEGEKILQKTTTEDVPKEIAPPTVEAALQTPPQAQNAAVNKSVLELFQKFRGEKSPNNLIALFKGAMAGNMQDPPLVLSDGKTSVRLIVNLPATGKLAINFAVMDAKLLSINKSGDSTWSVEVLPNKGAFDAAVIILQDGSTVKIPLTVAPPLSSEIKIGKGGELTYVDFDAFLKDRGTEKAPRYDLNGDGKRDYIDDYIFTANFLAKADAVKPAAKKKYQGAK